MKLSRFVPLASMTILCIGLPSAALGEVLVNPAIINSAPPFSPDYSDSFVFDSSKNTDYASAGQGTATFIDFDFGLAQTVDAFALITRNSQDDFISSYDLIFSDNADFSNPTVVSVNGDVNGNVGGRVDGPLRLFAPVTARYVRWDVTGVGSSAFFNQGANEIRFLKNTENLINGVSVINSSAPFSASFVASGAVNRNVGTSDFVPANEFASNSMDGGVNTFIDFDLGASALPINGFDFFQRHVAADRPLSFDVIFSDDPTFATNVQVRSYLNTQVEWTVSDTFAPISARFVRMDVTSVSGPGNLGLAEGLFYTVPEPGAALQVFAGLACMAGWKRRRG